MCLVHHAALNHNWTYKLMLDHARPAHTALGGMSGSEAVARRSRVKAGFSAARIEEARSDSPPRAQSTAFWARSGQDRLRPGRAAMAPPSAAPTSPRTRGRRRPRPPPGVALAELPLQGIASTGQVHRHASGSPTRFGGRPRRRSGPSRGFRGSSRARCRSARPRRRAPRDPRDELAIWRSGRSSLICTLERRWKITADVVDQFRNSE